MRKMLARHVVGLVVSVAAVSAFAQFTPNMGFAALKTEVAKQKSEGKSAAQIAQAAKAMGATNESQLTMVMLSQFGTSAAAEVVSAVISSFGDSDTVASNVAAAATSAGGAPSVVTEAAIAAGANVSTVTAATAAGPGTGLGGNAAQAQAPAAGNTGNAAAGIGGGFSGGSVFGGTGASPFSSLGGGGGGATTASRN